jgi:hypothetical protein
MKNGKVESRKTRDWWNRVEETADLAELHKGKEKLVGTEHLRKKQEINRMRRSQSQVNPNIANFGSKQENPNGGRRVYLEKTLGKGRVCGVGCATTCYRCVVSPFRVDVERSKHS